MENFICYIEKFKFYFMSNGEIFAVLEKQSDVVRCYDR